MISETFPENLPIEEPYHDYKAYVIRGNFDRMALVEEIIRRHRLLTFIDTGRTWIYNDKLGHYTPNAEALIKAYATESLSIEARKGWVEETLYLVKQKTIAQRDTLEPPINLINVENGILNTDTRTLTPHSSKWFFVGKWPVEYNPDAPHGEFRKFIEQLKLKTNQLQKFCGYMLTPNNKYKKALLIYGLTDTAKTTFLRVIHALLGPKNYSNVGLQQLGVRFQKQRLYGKAVNIDGDLSNVSFSNVATFKTTTGSDPIEAEVKGANKTIHFTWGGKHIFIANSLPEATGEADTDEFYNRLVLEEFTEQIPADKQDRHLFDKMTTPSELSDVLNWCLEGLALLEENGGFDHVDLAQLREHYKRAASPVYRFTQDHCNAKAEKFKTKEETYTTFMKYCYHHQIGSRSRSQFNKEILRHMPELYSDRRQIGKAKPHCWIGLEIVSDDAFNPPNPKEENTIDQKQTSLRGGRS